MKNNISLETSSTNNLAKYDYGKITKIVQRIRTFEKVSREDIIELNNASSCETDQNKKVCYDLTLTQYYNKSKVVKDLLENTIEKLLLSSNVANDILNALVSELNDGKSVNRKVQDKLIELVINNKYPQLNAKIIFILNKAVSTKEDYTDLANLADKLGTILTAEDTVVNRNILKIIEDSLNKTKSLSENTTYKLQRLSIDKEGIYKIRDNSLSVLLKAAEQGQELVGIHRLAEAFNDEVNGQFQDKANSILKLAENHSSLWAMPVNNLQSESHKVAFSDDSNTKLKDKNQEVLLGEIVSLNQDNSKILGLVSNNYLAETLEKISKKYQEDSQILPQNEAIENWQEASILAWSEAVKEITRGGRRIVEYLPEIIAVINRANYLDVGYELRPVQIMSVLILLNSTENGRLAQIATGEGKSTITAALAAVHAISGKSVDVITSSPILAKRDSQEKATFYKMLGLTCGDNTDKTDKEGIKACYKNDIIYGDVSSYQFDWLKSEYKKYGTRSNRPFDIAIVDEVDSMLIDEGGKIAKLSAPVPGIEYLEPILMAIWQQLGLIQNKFTYLSSSNQLLWIDGEFSNQDGELLLLGMTTENDVYIVDDAESFTINLLEDYIASLINQRAVMIPNHLIEFASSQGKYWAKAAISALNMEENRNYIIIDDEGNKKVAPVAYDSTGITQEKTQWGDGLHQFLEIKHGLKIQPEGLTSCFISNMGYFHRYGNKIYGMTGTLGSKTSQKLLQSSYNVDLTFIPTYKPKRFQELTAIIEDGREEWLASVTDNVMKEVSNGRACLIISETIADSMDIDKYLKEKGFPDDKIVNYYRSDNINQAEIITNKLDIGTVIVATNLAGRGTDIRTTVELEGSGGLHVCLTFLPANLRVEQQAFGRTSRQGNNGTGQLIINSDYERAKLQKAYPDFEPATTIEQFKKWRDLAEVSRIEEIISNQIPKLKLEDNLFNEFKQFIHLMRKQEDNKYKLLQLEELWSFWFRNIAHEKTYNPSFEQKTRTEFFQFREAMIALYNSGNQIINNPAYSVREGLVGMHSWDLENSIKHFNHAVNIDDKFSFAANYYLAYSVLKETTGHNKTNIEEAQKAAGHLIAARNQITNHVIPLWESMNIMLDPSYNDSMLSNQIHSKIDLLKQMVSSIDNMLEVIENASSEKIIRINNHTLLDSLYLYSEPPREEITELNQEGINELYAVEAIDVPKEPKGWSITNFVIAALGVAQIVIGIALSYATGGFAAKMSASIIAEGIKDVYNSVKATINRQSLNFKDYWTDKGISYAISMVAVGIESMKNTATASRQAATETGKQIAKEGGKEFTKEGVKEAAKKTFTEKFVDVGKQAVLTIIEQEGTLAIARGISGSLSKFRGSVKKNAIAEVKSVLDQPHIAKALTEILAVDRFLDGHTYQQQLMQKIEAALKPHAHKLFGISKRLVNAIGNHNATLKVVSNAIEASGYAQAVVEFNNILDQFCSDLGGIILEIHRSLPSTHQLIGMKLNVAGETSIRIINCLQQAGIVTGERSFNGQLIGEGFNAGIATTQAMGTSMITPFQYKDLKPPSVMQNCLLDQIDFGGGYTGSRKYIVTNQVRNLHTAYSADYSGEKARLSEILGQSVSSNMMNKLQTGLIQPASAITASMGVNKIHTVLAEHNNQVRAKLLRGQTRTIAINENGVILSKVNEGEDIQETITKPQSTAKKQSELQRIEQRLAEDYPNLPVGDRKKLVSDILRREARWNKHPEERPAILLASGGITSDVPLVTIPSVKDQAIRSVMNEYSSKYEASKISETKATRLRDSSTAEKVERSVNNEPVQEEGLFSIKGIKDKYNHHLKTRAAEQRERDNKPAKNLYSDWHERSVESSEKYGYTHPDKGLDRSIIKNWQTGINDAGHMVGIAMERMPTLLPRGIEKNISATFGVGNDIVGTGMRAAFGDEAIDRVKSYASSKLSEIPDGTRNWVGLATVKGVSKVASTLAGDLAGTTGGSNKLVRGGASAEVSTTIANAPLTQVKAIKPSAGDLARIEKIHKNSHQYVGETHVYRIIDSKGKTYKIGESAQGIRKRDGASIRAEQQTRKLHEETGERYETQIRKTFPNKKEAREYENKLIQKFRNVHGKDNLPGNKNDH